MKKGGRYDASKSVEGQFEPGSRGRVLKNLLGIKSKREMNQVEVREHRRALEKLIGMYDKTHRFTAADVCNIHKVWLGPVYAWAGEYRQVNVSKGGFLFAAIRAGMDRDYRPMEKVFSAVLRRTLRISFE